MYSSVWHTIHIILQKEQKLSSLDNFCSLMIIRILFRGRCDWVVSDISKVGSHNLVVKEVVLLKRSKTWVLYSAFLFMLPTFWKGGRVGKCCSYLTIWSNYLPHKSRVMRHDRQTMDMWFWSILNITFIMIILLLLEIPVG